MQYYHTLREIAFQELRNPEVENGDGYRKIKNCCAQATSDGLENAYIDTCCIDKRSSSELSEAVNSRLRWYSEAHVCYAYLEEVDITASSDWMAKFSGSRWFERRRTLQNYLLLWMSFSSTNPGTKWEQS